MIDNYFKEIDTNEKAYLLGFLYADGYIKGNRVMINLSEKDEVIIDKFVSALQGGKKVLRLIKGKYRSIFLTIFSKELCFDLRNHGFKGLKRDRDNLPILSGELYLPFLLGYYDGDGFEVGNVICSGNFKFLENIKNKFDITNDIKLKKNPLGQCYVLTIGVELRCKILKSYEFSLLRKRDVKYHKQVNGVSEIRISQHPGENYHGEPREIFNCKICDKEVSFESQYCWDCYQKNKSILRDPNSYFNKVKIKPSLQQLQDDLKGNSFVAVGEKYGVSDNAIRKWVKRYLKIYPEAVFEPKIFNFKVTEKMVSEWHHLKLEGITIKEIAKQYNVNTSTVKTHLEKEFQHSIMVNT